MAGTHRFAVTTFFVQCRLGLGSLRAKKGKHCAYTDGLMQHCYRCEVSRERHVRADEHAIAAGHRQPHALIM